MAEFADLKAGSIRRVIGAESSHGTDQALDSVGWNESGHEPRRSRSFAALGNPLAPCCCRNVFHEELVTPEQGLSGWCNPRGWFDLLVRAKAQRRGSRGCCHRVLVVQAPGAVAHTKDRRMDRDRGGCHPRRHRSLCAPTDSHRLALRPQRQNALPVFGLVWLHRSAPRLGLRLQPSAPIEPSDKSCWHLPFKLV